MSAQRRADRDLPPPSGCARQQQARNIRAADQQHDGDAAGKHAHGEIELAEKLLANTHHRGAQPVVGVGMLNAQLRRDGRHIPLRIGKVNARPQPREHTQIVGRATRPIRRRERHWKPDIAAAGENESGRHHADGAIFDAVEQEVASHHAGIGAVAFRPQAVAKQHYFRAARLIFLRRDAAAQHRRHAQQRQQVRGDQRDFHLLRLPIAGNGAQIAAYGGHIGEDVVAPLPIEHVGRRRSILREAHPGRVFPNLHHARGIFHLQRPQQQGIHHAENRHVGADSGG
jgi:hypothetical protein